MILLNSVIVLVAFVDSLRFSTYIMLSANKEFHFFPICMLVIVSSSSLHWLSTPVQRWMQMDEHGHSGLGSWFQGESIQFPTIKYYVHVGFSDIFIFYQVKEAPFLACSEFLPGMHIGILSKCFSWTYYIFLVGLSYWFDFQM